MAVATRDHFLIGLGAAYDGLIAFGIQHANKVPHLNTFSKALIVADIATGAAINEGSSSSSGRQRVQPPNA